MDSPSPAISFNDLIRKHQELQSHHKVGSSSPIPQLGSLVKNSPRKWETYLQIIIMLLIAMQLLPRLLQSQLSRELSLQRTLLSVNISAIAQYNFLLFTDGSFSCFWQHLYFLGNCC